VRLLLPGRFDHMDVDVEGKRLFIAAAENGSMEAVDRGAGKWRRSIPGFKGPTEACYVRELNKLFVASRDDGMVRVFRGDSLDLIGSIKLELGVNRAFYEPATQYDTAASLQDLIMVGWESLTRAVTNFLGT
jgi:hypothetical protein